MKRLDRPLVRISLDGMLIPFYANDDTPVIVKLEGVEFVPVFSTIEKLQEQLPIFRPVGALQIKQVNEGGTVEFINSVKANKLRIMLDPYTVGSDRTRWTEIAGPEDNPFVEVTDE